jgi:hypothetical protein
VCELPVSLEGLGFSANLRLVARATISPGVIAINLGFFSIEKKIVRRDLFLEEKNVKKNSKKTW